jgi:recombination protein RecA
MAKATKKSDVSTLDTSAPDLDARLGKLMADSKKLTSRWGMEDAASVPGVDLEQYQMKVYSTGLLSLDKKLKIGGIPRGHITELFGPPSAGKSLLLYQIIREIQHKCHACDGRITYADTGGHTEQTMLVRGKETAIKVKKRISTCTDCGAKNSGGLFALFDQENSFDPVWAESQGIELTKFVVFKMPSGEHALDLLRMVMNQHSLDGIGIDSIAQLQPKTEQERSSVDDATMMGLHAKIMAQLCRHVASSFLEEPKTAPAFIWVNQIRADVSGNNAIKVTGGYAPEHYSSIRIYMLRRGQVNQQHPEQGTEGRITIKKCKAAKGVVNRTLDYVLLDTGFDTAKDTYLTAVDSGIFLASALTSGGHFWAEDTAKENRLAAKRDECIERIRTDEAFAQDVRQRVMQAAGSQPVDDIYIGDSVDEKE